MKISAKDIAMVSVMAAMTIVATLLDKAYSQGLVAVGGAALAVCELICVVMVSLLFNKLAYSIIGGALFGVASFVVAFIFPSPLFQNPLVSIVPRLFIGIIGFGAYKLAGLLSDAYIAFAKKTHLHVAVPVSVLALAIAGMVMFFVFSGAEGFAFFIGLSGFVLLLILIGGMIPAIIAANRKCNERVIELFRLGVGAFFTVVANTSLVLPMMFLFGAQYQTLSDVYAILTVLNFLPELLITTIAAPVVIIGVRRGLRLGVDGKPRVKAASDVTDDLNASDVADAPIVPDSCAGDEKDAEEKK